MYTSREVSEALRTPAPATPPTGWRRRDGSLDVSSAQSPVLHAAGVHWVPVQASQDGEHQHSTHARDGGPGDGWLCRACRLSDPPQRYAGQVTVCENGLTRLPRRNASVYLSIYLSLSLSLNLSLSLSIYIYIYMYIYVYLSICIHNSACVKYIKYSI